MTKVEDFTNYRLRNHTAVLFLQIKCIVTILHVITLYDISTVHFKQYVTK